MNKIPKNSFIKTALTTALMLELFGTAQAAVIMVDNATCQLENAVISANSDTAFGGCTTGSGDDVIELPANSLISLGATLPTIAMTQYNLLVIIREGVNH